MINKMMGDFNNIICKTACSRIYNGLSAMCKKVSMNIKAAFQLGFPQFFTTLLLKSF